MSSTNHDGINTSRSEVIRSFCRWTSVRGLHHILRVENPILRLAWIIFTAIMLFSNIGLITLLLTHYYRFNTIENIKIQRGISVAFPHVTLCNVDPVNSDRVYCLKNPQSVGCQDAIKYVDILEKYKAAESYSQKYKNHTVLTTLEDPSMVAIFYQLIGMEAASYIGHPLNDFIVPNFCELTTREKGGILMKQTCKKAGIAPINFVTYKHFNCYTLSITDPDLSNRAVRLSAILYLDEESDLTCRPHCTHEFTEWAGSKIVIHPVGTFPDLERMGMNLLPGASNQILVDEIRQLEKKHLVNEPCESNVNNSLSIIYFDMRRLKFRNRSMQYTDTLCIQLLSQKATMDQCKCVDFLMPIPGSQIHRVNQLPFCGNLSLPGVDESLRCNQEVRTNNSKRFRELCPMPCVHLQYNYELTQLRWPQKPRILKYYKELKDRIYYNRKFRIYEEIDEMVQTNATLALQMLQQTDIFEQNFLQLDVNRPNFDTLVKYTENQEYSLPTLMSQLGGINSIFLGFTCVTVVELIELGCRLALAAWPSLNPSKRVSTSGPVVEQTELSNPEECSLMTNDRATRVFDNGIEPLGNHIDRVGIEVTSRENDQTQLDEYQSPEYAHHGINNENNHSRQRTNR